MCCCNDFVYSNVLNIMSCSIVAVPDTKPTPAQITFSIECSYTGSIICTGSGDDSKCCGELALFPGLPTVQFLITCSMQKRRGAVEGLGTRLAVNIVEKIDVARNCNESMQRNTYSSWCRFGGSRASSPLCPSFFFASPCSAKYSNLFSVSNLS